MKPVYMSDINKNTSPLLCKEGMGEVDPDLPLPSSPYKGEGFVSQYFTMRLYTKIALTLLIALLPTISVSGHLWAKEKSSLAKDINEIEEAYKSYADLSTSFTQSTHVVLIDRTINKRGTFRFKKGGKFKIAYEGRDGKHYVSDGITLWIFIPGDVAGLQTFAVDDKSVPKEALSFLEGFGKLKKEYKVSSSKAFPHKPQGWTALHLIPRKKSAHYKSLDALFRPDHLLSELIVTNVSGNVSHYRFQNTRTNVGLADGLFTYP